MVKALVSIITYNGSYKTTNTISNIVNQQCDDNLSLRLLVIDNCSSNDIAKTITKLYKDCDIVTTSSNIGFSGGHNISIELAIKNEVDFLFILNDDIQVSHDYIQEMIKAGIDLPDAAVLGSTIRLANGKIQAVCGYIKSWYAGVLWSNNKSKDNQYSIREVDVIQGAAFMLTKTALQNGFRFDEGLFFGGEEYDLGYWSKANKLKVYVLEHIEVIHDTNQTELITNRWHPDAVQYYYCTRNNIYLNLKHNKHKLIKHVALFCTMSRGVTKGLIFLAMGNKDIIIHIVKGVRHGILRKMGRLQY